MFLSSFGHFIGIHLKRPGLLRHQAATEVSEDTESKSVVEIDAGLFFEKLHKYDFLTKLILTKHNLSWWGTFALSLFLFTFSSLGDFLEGWGKKYVLHVSPWIRLCTAFVWERANFLKIFWIMAALLGLLMKKIKFWYFKNSCGTFLLVWGDKFWKKFPFRISPPLPEICPS